MQVEGDFFCKKWCLHYVFGGVMLLQIPNSIKQGDNTQLKINIPLGGCFFLSIPPGTGDP